MPSRPGGRHVHEAMIPITPPRSNEQALPAGLLARVESSAAAAGERALVDYVTRLLDERGVDTLLEHTRTVVPALRSLVMTLPFVIRDGTPENALAVARALGEAAHEGNVTLATLIDEGRRLHDSLLQEISLELRQSDHTVAWTLLRVSRAIMELEQTALLAFQERTLAGLTSLALSDGLTGLANRRAFDEHLTQELQRAQRLSHDLALVVLDMDGMKTVNDTFGHAAGDTLLIAAAALLREHTRSIDLVARIGGDEFALILPACDLAGAHALVHRLEAGARLRVIQDRPPRFSAGVALYQGSEQSPDDLFRAADEDMYRAKRGR